MKKRNHRNSSTDAAINRCPTYRERFLELQLEAAQSESARLREELNSAQSEMGGLRKELETAQSESAQLRKELENAKQGNKFASDFSSEAAQMLEKETERANTWRCRFWGLCLGLVTFVLVAIWLNLYQDYQESHTPLTQVVTTVESEDLAIENLCVATLYNEAGYDLARALVLEMNKEDNLFVIRDEAAFGETYLDTRWLKATELWLRQNFQGFYQYTRNGNRYTVLIKKPSRATFPEPAPTPIPTTTVSE